MKLEDHPLIKTALTHRSLAAIEKVESNEMLEFLGDRVLDLIVTEIILKEYPDMNEGVATKVRTTVCNTESVAGFCRRFKWQEKLRLPRAAQQQKLRLDLKVQADTFEAVVGAWYQIYGFDYVREKLAAVLKRAVLHAGGSGEWYDGKVEVNDLAQKLGMRVTYRVNGPHNNGSYGPFSATVALESRIFGKGKGKTPKMAEQAAARSAVHEIKRHFTDQLAKAAG